MKNFFIFLFIIISFFIFGEDFKVDNYSELYEKFGVRDEAGVNEKDFINYTESFCAANGLDYKIIKINNGKDIITNSYNVEIYFKGSTRDNEQTVIFCPLNTPVLNQEFTDNSLSLQIFFDLIMKCKSLSFNKNLIFILSGANDGQYSKYAGIDFFIGQNDDINKSFVMILDILSEGQKIRFSGSGGDICISSEILGIFINSGFKSYNIYFDKKEIYSSRLLARTFDNYQAAFLKKGIHCIGFSNRENFKGFDAGIAQSRIDGLSLYFFEWIRSLDGISTPVKQDKHFYYFDIFGINILIPEVMQILFLMIFIFLIIMVRIFFPHFQRFHRQSLMHFMPYSGAIFALFYFSAFIPYLIFSLFGYLLKIPDFHYSVVIIYLIDIFLIPLFAVIFFFEFFKKWPFPKHEYLYIYGALMGSFLNLIILTLLDISLVYIYLWTIIMIVLAQYNRKRLWLVIIFYVLSALPFAVFVYDLIVTSSFYALNRLNPFISNLIYSIFIFPYVLLIIKVYIILRSNIASIINKIYYALTVLIILSLSVIMQFIFSGFFFNNDGVLQVKLFAKTKENYGYFDISSDDKIGNITLFYDDKNEHFKINGMYKRVMTGSVDPGYEIKIEKFFSDYLYYNFHINSGETIEYLRIYIICDNNIYPVESNFQFERTEEYKGAYNKQTQSVYFFNPGRNPGKEILFRLSMLDGLYKIIFEIDYPFIKSGDLKIDSRFKYINRRTCYIEEMELFN